MKYYVSTSHDATYNLAIEEYLLKNQEEEILYLWVNSPTIVIGRNQNTFAEINEEEVRQREITVVRRDTGGGAVYHDLGNLNFSLVMEWSEEKHYEFSKFLEPVIEALSRYGIKASVEGRNDLLIDGKKVSGNAQTIYKNRLLHHGTLLFDTDLTVIGKVLQVSRGKLEGKGIKSIRSRVGNICEYALEPFSIEEFEEAIISCFCKVDAKELKLASEWEAEIRRLQREKYQSWDYVYGQSMEANYVASEKLACGNLTVELQVDHGLIKMAHFSGDFLCMKEVAQLTDQLVGVKYQYNEVFKVLESARMDTYLKGVAAETLARLFFPRS